jgi:hypothetical protein
MKVDGIDYGLGTPWEIDVPDDSIVIENTEESRIPPALADVPQAVRDAIRNPMGTAPLAMLFNEMTTKIALGAVVTRCPTMTGFDIDPVEAIRTGDWVRVDADRGVVEILRRAPEAT